MREKCVAWLHPEKPCWEHENTACEVITGRRKECRDCKVFWRYGRK
jgi:hypothetical protein